MGSLIYELSELGDLMVMSFWSVHFVFFRFWISKSPQADVFFHVFFSYVFMEKGRWLNV